MLQHIRNISEHWMLCKIASENYLCNEERNSKLDHLCNICQKDLSDQWHYIIFQCPDIYKVVVLLLSAHGLCVQTYYKKELKSHQRVSHRTGPMKQAGFRKYIARVTSAQKGQCRIYALQAEDNIIIHSEKQQVRIPHDSYYIIIAFFFQKRCLSKPASHD